MKTKRYLLIAVLALLCAFVAFVWAPAPTKAEDIVYEVRPQVAVPYGYSPEQSRLIDLLEHLLVSNRQAAEQRFSRVETNLAEVMEKLEKIEKSLTDLSVRIAGIETALGIEQPAPPKKQPNTKPAQKATVDEKTTTGPANH